MNGREGGWNVVMVARLIPGAAAAVGALALALWLTASRASDVDHRVPVNSPASSQPGVQAGPETGTAGVTKGPGVPADLPGAWPRFRGPNLDNVSPETVELARHWGPGGPPILWTVEMGEGYAGPAVLEGRVYVLDYDPELRTDALRCLSLADGREIWRFAYPVKIKRQHGISRTVVAVTDRHVVGLGPLCHVTCVDAKTGALLWPLNLVSAYGAQVPKWYAGQCPLIEDGRLILAPGGPEALLVAIEIATGKEIWRTPNPRGWLMTHSSVMPMEFQGRRMYVYCADSGVVGVAATDGALLWEFPGWRVPTANIPSPVPLGDGRIFLSGGYHSGSLMLRVREEGGKLSVEPDFALEWQEFGSEQQTPILYQGYLYGVSSNGELVCLDPSAEEPEKRIVWRSGRANRFGLGPYLIAGGLLFVMNDSAELTLAEATPQGYRALDRAKVFDHGEEAWGPMALAGGRLIVRDLKRMACLDVSRKGAR
jgi:outer membrane protein assembly factor BamB